MSNHVTEHIADYAEGRLDSEREGMVKSHVNTCTDCAADLAFALQLREYGTAEGMRHFSAERIARLASEPDVRMTEAEQRHMDECDQCRSDFELASTVPPDDAWEEIVSTPAAAKREAARSKPWFRGWKLLPAAVAAAVLLIIAIPDREDFRHVARIEPLTVHISRGAVAPGFFESVRRRGLELYRDGDYQKAREHFTEANELKGDAEVQLYLGSIELLLGNNEAAAAMFDSIIKGQPRSAIREEALWQLANTQISAGSKELAKDTLEKVIDAGGSHKGDAQALLERLAH